MSDNIRKIGEEVPIGEMNHQINGCNITIITRNSTFQSDKNINRIIKTRVKDLKLDFIKSPRAGVILYTIVEDAMYFGMGLDSKSHDLTDFGGGVSYKTDGDAITGALREFQEETLDIFQSLKTQDVLNSPVIYNERNLVIFLRVGLQPDQISKTFNKAAEKIIKSGREPEVCSITWLSWEDFNRHIHSGNEMFSRLKRFLFQAGDFAYLL